LKPNLQDLFLTQAYLHISKIIWTLLDQHTQAYNTFVFVIIKTMNRVNNFPLFDDDKPNDHIELLTNMHELVSAKHDLTTQEQTTT